LEGGKLADAGCRRGIPKDRRAPDVGCNLLEQFHPFPAHAVFEISEPRGVAAWARQALEDASANRIGEICEYDGNGASCLLHRRDRAAAHGYDHDFFDRNQFARILTTPLDPASAKQLTDLPISSDCPAQQLEGLRKYRAPYLCRRISRNKWH